MVPIRRRPLFDLPARRGKHQLGLTGVTIRNSRSKVTSHRAMDPPIRLLLEIVYEEATQDDQSFCEILLMLILLSW